MRKVNCGVGSFRNSWLHMDVYKNKGNPKWMVYFMENPIKIHDLGVPLFLETPILKKPRLFCSIVSDFGLNQVDDFGLCFFLRRFFQLENQLFFADGDNFQNFSHGFNGQLLDGLNFGRIVSGDQLKRSTKKTTRVDFLWMRIGRVNPSACVRSGRLTPMTFPYNRGWVVIKPSP